MKKINDAQLLFTQAQRKTLQASEIEVAEIVSVYFQNEVSFITARNTYKAKTPDIEVNGIIWELKSPQGNSKRDTIKRQLRRGKRQSRNIILSTLSTPLEDDFIHKEIQKLITRKEARIHHFILVDKNKQVHLLK